MTALLTGRQVSGSPVVTIDGGEAVAEVRDLVFHADGSLAGLTLNKRGFLKGRMKELLVAENIAAVGPDAVMIADDACLVATTSAPDDLARAGQGSGDAVVLGDEVITEGGTTLGTVTDVIVLCGGGLSLVGYALQKPDKTDAFIPLPAQRSVSGSHVVVPDELTSLIRHDLTGLGEAVTEYRDQVGRPAGSTPTPPAPTTPDTSAPDTEDRS